MHALSHDNRGTAEVPFGFVYFDDCRVLYANGEVTSYEGPYWKSPSDEQVSAAAEYLRQAFPGMEFTVLP